MRVRGRCVTLSSCAYGHMYVHVHDCYPTITRASADVVTSTQIDCSFCLLLMMVLDFVLTTDPCAGQPACMMACDHGMVKDENGCDTCECAAG